MCNSQSQCRNFRKNLHMDQIRFINQKQIKVMDVNATKKFTINSTFSTKIKSYIFSTK